MIVGMSEITLGRLILSHQRAKNVGECFHRTSPKVGPTQTIIGLCCLAFHVKILCRFYVFYSALDQIEFIPWSHSTLPRQQTRKSIWRPLENTIVLEVQVRRRPISRSRSRCLQRMDCFWLHLMVLRDRSGWKYIYHSNATRNVCVAVLLVAFASAGIIGYVYHQSSTKSASLIAEEEGQFLCHIWHSQDRSKWRKN